MKLDKSPKDKISRLWHPGCYKNRQTNKPSKPQGEKKNKTALSSQPNKVLAS